MRRPIVIPAALVALLVVAMLAIRVPSASL